MAAAGYHLSHDKEGTRLALTGDWTSLGLSAQALGLGRAVGGQGSPPRLDLAGLGRIDTAGAYAILSASQGALPAGQLRPDVARLFSLVAPSVAAEAEPAPRSPWLSALLEQIGRAVHAAGGEALAIAEFAGRLNLCFLRTLRSPSRLRGISLVHAMETAGADALPIIMVMNFFIGAVVALVGTNLLASLGAGVLTVQLVGVAVLREFGVLITAILLAGRSASSFAAQIGSMKMAQEIDAMQVIGVDRFDALVVPRVVGLVVMMPLLVFGAMLAGIAGGLIVSWAALDVSPIFFLQRMHDTVSIRHFWVGMSKVPVLAMLIGMAGCRHGLAVGGDVESLGRRVTMAVVQAIFMIILFDALFAIIYMQLKL